jgi:hypothetical protein
MDYTSYPDKWRTESQRAVRAAALFSYNRYLKAVRSLLNIEEPGNAAMTQRVTGTGAAPEHLAT